MKIKKMLVSLLVALVISASTINIIFPVIEVYAHSGRTDQFGGHKDTKNRSGLGRYHYHHGYPAHLHENGVCPYANGYPKSGYPSTSSNSSSLENNNINITQSNNVEDSFDSNNVDKGIIIISDTSYDSVAFNASYYANKHNDVYVACGDNAKSLYEHFITYGILEGRQSSAQFSILIYKQNNSDLVDAFGDDLIKYYNHFIEFGYNEGRISN